MLLIPIQFPIEITKITDRDPIVQPGPPGYPVKATGWMTEAETKNSDPPKKKKTQTAVSDRTCLMRATPHHTNRELYMIPSVGYTPSRCHTHVHIISEFINWSYLLLVFIKSIQKRKK